MTYKKKIFLVVFFIFSNILLAQNNRINTDEAIGWYGFFGTFKLSDKIGIHTEYQWRREDLITNWQQGLLRLGILITSTIQGYYLD